MAVNASKWRKISSRDQNEASSIVSCLIADADPELCVKLLKTPSRKTFSGIRPRLEKASKEWLSEFLNLGGFDCLLEGLTSLSSGNGLKFTEALEQIECVRCIKAVMNSSVGLEVITASNEFTRSFIKGKSDLKLTAVVLGPGLQIPSSNVVYIIFAVVKCARHQKHIKILKWLENSCLKMKWTSDC